jgi:hypothetical protein
MNEKSSPPAAEPDPKYGQLATEAQLERATRRLREHGFVVVVVPGSSEARYEVLGRIPAGSDVFNGQSQTLEETGILKALGDRPDVTLIKVKTRAMDRQTQADEIRRLSQAPSVVIGSVHAVTEDGEVLAASYTGNQIGPYAFGGGRVIWVVGAQKIVPSLAEGLNRIERYCLRLEDQRTRKVYGIGSAPNRILIFRAEDQPGRTTIILVKERLGF